jgi:hypothetical protein
MGGVGRPGRRPEETITLKGLYQQQGGWKDINTKKVGSRSIRKKEPKDERGPEKDRFVT